MSFDFYANFQFGTSEYSKIKDVYSKMILLSTALGEDEKSAKNELKSIIRKNNGVTYNKEVFQSLFCKPNQDKDSKLLELNEIDISALPEWSWAIEFPITLASPFISKDDIPLYIIDNPVRKDKVFGVPFTSAMAWKGNLRWTMMKTQLETKADKPDKFAETRLRHDLLFGNEKGFEEKETKGWAKYVNGLCPDAVEKYQAMMKKQFEGKDNPNFAGMLYFYPTFWDKIDLEVINPHNRKTKAGGNVIYFETVPAGSQGMFRLLYVPLHRLGLAEKDFWEAVWQDLEDVAKGLEAMMTKYGFSAKKSSGYGVINKNFGKDAGNLMVKKKKTEKQEKAVLEKATKKKLSGFGQLGEHLKPKQEEDDSLKKFSNFEELHDKVKTLKGELIK